MVIGDRMDTDVGTGITGTEAAQSFADSVADLADEIPERKKT